MKIRQLVQSDAEALEHFLAAHRDSSMFLRSNLRRAGVAYHGEPFQALYAAALDGEDVVGVVAHCWNGMLLAQAPAHAEDLSRAVVEGSSRRVSGFQGPLEQVRRMQSALDMGDATATIDAPEGLFALTLGDLVVPRLEASEGVECRPPLPVERSTLLAWRLAYDIEAMGAIDSAETRDRGAWFLDSQIESGNAWVAVERGRPVSLSGFNAALPDIVQLGGIYTPPEHRGRGFAKVAVAASLLAARDRGATRAVLFTNNPSAERCYAALGFRRIGDYGLVLLR